eukprot:893790-Rhodomonas_salina.1
MSMHHGLRDTASVAIASFEGSSAHSDVGKSDVRSGSAARDGRRCGDDFDGPAPRMAAQRIPL